jgi:hypothetical protein
MILDIREGLLGVLVSLESLCPITIDEESREFINVELPLNTRLLLSQGLLDLRVMLRIYGDSRRAEEVHLRRDGEGSLALLVSAIGLPQRIDVSLEAGELPLRPRLGHSHTH